MAWTLEGSALATRGRRWETAALHKHAPASSCTCKYLNRRAPRLRKYKHPNKQWLRRPSNPAHELRPAPAGPAPCVVYLWAKVFVLWSKWKANTPALPEMCEHAGNVPRPSSWTCRLRVPLARLGAPSPHLKLRLEQLGRTEGLIEQGKG